MTTRDSPDSLIVHRHSKRGMNHICNSLTSITLRYRAIGPGPDYLQIEIPCREPEWQLFSIEQVSTNLLRPLSTVEDLYIQHRYRKLVWKDGANEDEDALWLELLGPSTAVKNLYLSKEFAPGIAVALQGLATGGRVTEVLPSLLTIFVEGIGPWGPF